jgi:hypothetical protein
MSKSLEVQGRDLEQAVDDGVHPPQDGGHGLEVGRAPHINGDSR